MNLIKIAGKICLVVCLCFSLPAISQVNQSTVNSIRVDDMSDERIRQFISTAEDKGYDPLDASQLQKAAAEAGIVADQGELQKLVIRVQRVKAASTGKAPLPAGRRSSGDRQVIGLEPAGQADTLSAEQKQQAAKRAKIFGAKIFSTSNLTFEPNLRLATPKSYIIGPDDELLIDIYGYSEANYNVSVTPEGSITLPYVGVIKVGGISIEQATSRIKNRLSTIYSGIRTGNTFVNINIGNIRSIKVILTGEIVKPGTYTLPSLATVFNALYSSGGPTANGSFRQIDLIRSGRTIARIDIYDFLLTGQLKNDIRLQDQDVIRVPTYKKRVEIEGEVKIPGIFEMLPGEKFSDLLKFTGDFTEEAYRDRITILKNTSSERRLIDLTSDQFSIYGLDAGDKILVSKILDRFANRVTIDGAVFRPGPYELTEGLTVKKLIQNAEGVKEDAFRNRASISRLKEDNQLQAIDFDLGQLLAGTIADIPLKREDVVHIFSIGQLKENFFVSINGEVRNPGNAQFAEGMTVEDLIIQAGGLKEGASPNRVEIARRVFNSNALSLSAETSKIIIVNINSDLKSAASSTLLKPFDIVTVRPSSGYEVQRQVKVSGEVVSTGLYAISKKDERISDLVRRAGGLTAIAYVEGASLKRPGIVKNSNDAAAVDAIENQADSEQRERQFQRLQNKVNGASDQLVIEDVNNYVGIDLKKILKSPGSKDDIFLEDGDELRVPKQLQTVKVNGEVLSPNTVLYTGRKGFREYISNAGGFTQKAQKRHAFIRYANGSVKSASRILFFTNYPAVKPGAEIFVPQKQERKGLSAAEIVGITSAIASLGAIVLGVLNLSK